jgi:hypothetical protein
MKWRPPFVDRHIIDGVGQRAAALRTVRLRVVLRAPVVFRAVRLRAVVFLRAPVAFLAVRLRVVFLAPVAFFAVRLRVVFRAPTFLAVRLRVVFRAPVAFFAVRLRVVLRAVDLRAVDLRAVDLRAVDFLAARLRGELFFAAALAVFFAATLPPRQPGPSRVDGLRVGTLSLLRRVCQNQRNFCFGVSRAIFCVELYASHVPNARKQVLRAKMTA